MKSKTLRDYVEDGRYTIVASSCSTAKEIQRLYPKAIVTHERSDVKEFYDELRERLQMRANGQVLPDGPSGAELIIPDIIVNRIRERIGDFTTLYPLVDKVIAKGRVKLILDVDTSEATWLEMRGALPEEDDSKLTAVEFDGFKIGRIVYIDNSLLEDSVINLDDYLTKRIARSIAKGLDKAIDVRSNQIAANTMKEVTKLRSLVERIQDVVFPKEDVVITEGGVPDVSN